jgi:RHS repeat-associated protein
VHTSQPFGEGDSATALVYDDGQVVLQFDAQIGYSSPVDLESTDLSHRYVWNPQSVDQLLADENVWSLFDTIENETLWALGDQQGSVTDMVDDAGRLRIHRAFDSFGNIVGETHYDTDELEVSGPVSQFGYLDEAFAYTGRLFDKDTGLQNNLNRWYDPKLGRFLSEDPIEADVNSYRYVGNSPVNGVDPSGLQPPGEVLPILHPPQDRLGSRDGQVVILPPETAIDAPYFQIPEMEWGDVFPPPAGQQVLSRPTGRARPDRDPGTIYCTVPEWLTWVIGPEGPGEAPGRPFPEKLKDIVANPEDWVTGSSHSEPGRSVRGRGGVSEQIKYRNRQTGETIVRHRVIDRRGRVIDDHYRPDYKPRLNHDLD